MSPGSTAEKSRSPLKVGELAAAILEGKIKKEYERNELITGPPCGLLELDRIISGFHSGELIVFAGRRGACKTALALTITLSAATNEDEHHSVALFTLELSAEEATLRMLCADARVDSRNVRRGFLGQGYIERLEHASTRLNQASILVDDEVSMSAAAIWDKCQFLQKSFGPLGLVVVDYIQLLRACDISVCGEPSPVELLKGLAEDLNLPVVAFWELNYPEETRPPLLWDLRDSGVIEQADVIGLISRRSASGIVNIEVVKHPTALPDTAVVAFEPSTGLMTTYNASAAVVEPES